MAHKEFILQGFTKRTHGMAIRELFDLPEIQKVVLSVAFVSESGVDQIVAELKAHAARVTVFAGIRNDITSHQGLKRLHAIASKLYVVDTGSRMVVFHPKIYMVRSKSHARLLLGSANLTLGGLNNNIEAGMLINFDLANAADKAVVDEIEAQLTALPADYPGNILKISSVAELDSMLASGRLVDEMAIPPPRPTTSAGTAGASDLIGRIKLKVPPIRRALVAAKARKKPKVLKHAGPTVTSATTSGTISTVVGVEFELVWQSKPLSRHALDIPKSSRTHPAGSINLGKGLLPILVDQRHYFRNEVFSALAWTPKNATGKVEEAYAKFQLIVKGISYDEFDLRIDHDTDTTTPTYAQSNVMTRLSWGLMRAHIARPDLLGRTLALYRDKADPTLFLLEID